LIILYVSNTFFRIIYHYTQNVQLFARVHVTQTLHVSLLYDIVYLYRKCSLLLWIIIFRNLKNQSRSVLKNVYGILLISLCLKVCV